MSTEQGSTEGRPRFLRDSLLFVIWGIVLAIIFLLLVLWSNRKPNAPSATDLLLTAAAQGDVDGATHALAAGANVSMTDVHGQSAFEMALRRNDLALARCLLEAGADPNALMARNVPTGVARPMQHASLPLHFCIENGYVAMTELLLDFRADIERSGMFSKARMIGSGPPLFAAIECDQPTDIRLEMVRLLLKRGADARRDYGERNAMDFAVFRSDSQIGDLLRQRGADYGPREMVAFNRLDEIRRVVKERPNVLRDRFRPTWAAKPGLNPTLLGFALERGHREMAKFLIESGAPLNTVEYCHDQTPMHMAVVGGDPEVIKLLAARGVNVNARDSCKDTPLHDLAWRDKPEAVAALIQAGADVNARGGAGRTALHSAVGNNRVEVVRMLLAAGADPTIRDGEGESVLDWPVEPAPDEMRKTTYGGQRKLPKVKPEIAALLKQATARKRGK